jgi:hypothetical protein
MLVDENSRERIPVVQHRETNGNVVGVTAYYEAFLALSALLIEQEEGVLAKWGVIVDSRSMKGFAIPLTASLLSSSKAFISQLAGASEATYPFTMRAPADKACKHCPLGFPRSIGQRTKLAEKLIDPFFYSLKDVRDTRDKLPTLRATEQKLVQEAKLAQEELTQERHECSGPTATDSLADIDDQEQARRQIRLEEYQRWFEDDRREREQEHQNQRNIDLQFGIVDPEPPVTSSTHIRSSFQDAEYDNKDYEREEEERRRYYDEEYEPPPIKSFDDWLADSKKSDRGMHSDCGDIFQWAPDHIYWEKGETRAYEAYCRWKSRSN